MIYKENRKVQSTVTVPQMSTSSVHSFNGDNKSNLVLVCGVTVGIYMIADINDMPAVIGMVVRNAARLECCFACSLNASRQRLFDNYIVICNCTP